MKNNWQTKKIGEVFEIKPSKKEARDRLKGDDFVSFVPMEDLGILTKNIVATKTRQLKEVSGSYTYFSDNDVLLAKITPCFENGKVGIARNLKNGIGFGSSEYIVFRPNGELIPDYLFYFLSREDFRDEGKRVMSGAVGHKRVPKDFIQNYSIPYPTSLEEQKRIIAILDKVFEKIEKTKKNTERNLQNSRGLFESYLENIFLNTKGDWQVAKMRDKNLLQIIDGDRGKNYPSKSDFSTEGFCLFLNTKNVRPEGFDFKTTMFISQKKDTILGNGKLQRNDVVMTTRGTIGNLGLYSDEIKYENIRINSGMLIFRSNTKLIFPEYLFEILRSEIIKKQIEKNVSGAAQPQLPIKTLVNFTIPIPKSISEQKEIVEKLDGLSEQTRKLEEIYRKKLADLEELKKSVLQSAFTPNSGFGETKKAFSGEM